MVANERPILAVAPLPAADRIDFFRPRSERNRSTRGESCPGSGKAPQNDA